MATATGANRVSANESDKVFEAVFAGDDEESPNMEELVEVLQQHISLSDRSGKRLVVRFYLVD